MLVQEGGETRTLGEVVREVYPDANDDLVMYLLWERTAYPHAGTDYILKQLKTLKATEDAGLKPCDYCNDPATVMGKVFNLCADCERDETT